MLTIGENTPKQIETTLCLDDSYLPAVPSIVLRRTEKEKSIGVSIAGLSTSTQAVTVLFSS